MANKEDNTLISLAEVRDRFDPDNSGRFIAKIFALGTAEEWVHYVSPYGTGNEGGLIAVPEVGVTILVCRPAGSSSFYYLGSTFLGEPGQALGPALKEAEGLPFSRVDPDINRARGEPLHIVFKGERGGGLKISEDYNPTFFNVKTEITSSKGKKVSLIDSPGSDMIVIDANPDLGVNKVTLGAGAENSVIPESGIEIETTGPQKFLNHNASTDIYIADGRELNLINSSTGANVSEEDREEGLYGNINLQSKRNDINVFSLKESGRIFLQCLDTEGEDQWVVIETKGENGGIQIKTNGKVDIQSGGDMNIDCGNNLNIRAQGNINMNASNGAIRGNASQNIELQGTEVQLNPGSVTTTPPSISDVENHYGDDGVTTYP